MEVDRGLIIMKILLLEDEPILRFYLKTRLSEINGLIDAFRSVEEALKKLYVVGINYYDAYIIDLDLGQLSGVDFIDKTRELGSNSLIIIQSAYFHKYQIPDDDRIVAQLKKPASLDLLESVVAHIEKKLGGGG